MKGVVLWELELAKTIGFFGYGYFGYCVTESWYGAVAGALSGSGMAYIFYHIFRRKS
ncbi:MAG: hypothetical protein RI909_2063 [Bacteroidota bacterium]|jgi:hypothetical protein